MPPGTIRKAVIPAAGLGTRVLPATKAVPKPLLPLADKPTIQYVVEEAVASGIEHIIIITSAATAAIEDHFRPSPELEAALQRKGDLKTLEAVRHVTEMAQITFVRQEEPRGLGHAVLLARDIVGDEPFGVLLADDLVDHPSRPCLRQLLDVHERHGGAVLAVMPVPREQVSRYGVVALDPARQQGLEPRTHRVSGLVEKPPADRAPSNLIVVGRYVLPPGIFAALAATSPSGRGEIELTDGIQRLGEREPVYAYEFDGTRYDIGTPVGLLTTSLALSLERPDLAPEVRAFLRTLRLDDAD
ncbi:MAG TPA: UTP--glucose-1-phosphate uridylyltransferase [Ktedonobacterales bacterium]|jgi:UTP--glucose-1-phosphate uridylyltransferase